MGGVEITPCQLSTTAVRGMRTAPSERGVASPERPETRPQNLFHPRSESGGQLSPHGKRWYIEGGTTTLLRSAWTPIRFCYTSSG